MSEKVTVEIALCPRCGRQLLISDSLAEHAKITETQKLAANEVSVATGMCISCYLLRRCEHCGEKFCDHEPLSRKCLYDSKNFQAAPYEWEEKTL